MRELLAPAPGSSEEKELRSAYPTPFDYDKDVLGVLATTRM